MSQNKLFVVIQVSDKKLRFVLYFSVRACVQREDDLVTHICSDVIYPDHTLPSNEIIAKYNLLQLQSVFAFTFYTSEMRISKNANNNANLIIASEPIAPNITHRKQTALLNCCCQTQVFLLIP